MGRIIKHFGAQTHISDLAFVGVSGTSRGHFTIQEAVQPLVCAVDLIGPDLSPFRRLEIVDVAGGSVSQYRPK